MPRVPTDPLGLNCDPNNWGKAVPPGGCGNIGGQSFTVSATMPPGIPVSLWEFLAELYWSDNCGCINVKEMSRLRVVMPPSFAPQFGGAIDATADGGPAFSSAVFSQVWRETDFLNHGRFYGEWWLSAAAVATGVPEAEGAAGAAGAGARWLLAGAAAAATTPGFLTAAEWAQGFANGWSGRYAASWANAAGATAHDIYQTIACPPWDGQCG